MKKNIARKFEKLNSEIEKFFEIISKSMGKLILKCCCPGLTNNMGQPLQNSTPGSVQEPGVGVKLICEKK